MIMIYEMHDSYHFPSVFHRNLPEEPPTYPGPPIQNLTNSKAQTQPDPEAEIRERLAKLKEKDCDRESHTSILSSI